MSHVINIWGGDANLFWRADGYGWHATTPEENTNGSGWFTYLGSNTRWGTEGAEFREDITGSDVVLTLARVGGELRITQDFTATSGQYRRYFVVNYGNAENSIWAQLAVEYAHVTVTENYSITDTDIPTITGTLIGLENNTSPFWTAWSDYFTIEPNKTFTLRYKNYSNRINNFNGPLSYITTDFDRGATGYTEYFGLRPDNYVNLAGKNATTTNFDVISWNWGTFREKIDGATVTLTITRTGSDVRIREEFAPADGSTTLWEEYNQDCGDGTQNIRVFLTVEGAHLDLLPVSTTIGATGWATYCNNDYALDFTNVDGLSAYIVTGASGSAITKEAVTKVPAGTPLLLNGTASTTYNIPIIGTYSTDVSANKLKAGTGAPVSKESGYDRYVLVASGDKAVFQLINTTAATVPTGKAYLEFTATPARETLFLDESDVVTSINAVEAAENNGAVYNLQGQRVERMGKGIYVKDGKKFINK